MFLNLDDKAFIFLLSKLTLLRVISAPGIPIIPSELLAFKVVLLTITLLATFNSGESTENQIKEALKLLMK